MATQKIAINNEIYDSLGERWYTAKDDPVALLRAESKFLGPWIQSEINKRLGDRSIKILDIGCGGGFNSNYLASQGHDVHGVDLSPESINIAARQDKTKSVTYQVADATKLPFSDGAFDVVLAMDFLEHVDDVKGVIAEASRVTKSGGVFFFHTFNRNFLAWLINIKLVEWFIPNTPKHMHVLHMFLTPEEITLACQQAGFSDTIFVGTKPKLGRLSHWYSVLVKREVPDDFGFEFTKSVLLSYCGISLKL